MLQVELELGFVVDRRDLQRAGAGRRRSRSPATPSSITDVVVKRVDQLAPSREPCSPGRPVQPTASSGSTDRRTGTSTSL